MPDSRTARPGQCSRTVLFVSWQGGLGHITRDLAIVKKLRQHIPDCAVSWMAHPLACRFLQQTGETILPESRLGADYNKVALQAIRDFSLNLMRYIGQSQRAWAHNIRLFKQVIADHRFDLVIGDEAYEIADAMAKGRVKLDCPMAMIEDFIGLEAMTPNPVERLGIYLNNLWLAAQGPLLRSRLTRLFVGELEDVPGRRFGLLLPNRREFASKYYHLLGYVVRSDPAEYADKRRVRAQLGYGEELLLICATGGLSAGKELLETCGEAYSLLKVDIPNLHMVAVCGELLGEEPPSLPSEVELYDYFPDLYQHYAACDMAVVVGGGTTTLELTALRRPFVFFPLENQFDQQLYVAERPARHGAGIKMRFHQTSPESLAQAIRTRIGQEVDWPPIPTRGAQEAAEVITGLLVGAP